MTDIPDDVYDELYGYLDGLARGVPLPNLEAQHLLTKLPPRSQPKPAWRVGTHYGIHVYAGDVPVATFLTAADAKRAVEAVNGRRVHPPRFAEHAAVLRIIAHSLRTKCVLDGTEPASLDRIATVLAGDNDE